MSTIQLASNTLAVTPATGQIEYNGQYYATDSNNTRGQLERITQMTALVSTSGTSITFTGIPAWAKKITVMFTGVSTAGASNILVQIGSGSPTTTGYSSASSRVAAAGATAFATVTSGFNIYTSGATDILYGIMNISNITGNTWVQSHCFADIPTGVCTIQGGGASSNLSGSLDRVVITSTASDTFDGGVINIMYEG